MTPEEYADRAVLAMLRGRYTDEGGMRDEVARAVREAVAEMTRYRDAAVAEMGNLQELLGRLRGGQDAADAVAALRERVRDEERERGVLERLAAMSPEARAEVFSHFCRECGGDDPECPCWNDE